MSIHRAAAAALGALIITWGGTAAAYVVGGPEEADHPSSSVWNWENGPTTAPFRAALEEPNYFGPGGVVEETIFTQTVDMDGLDPFAGLDGFIVPWWLDGEVTPYRNAIRDFFLAGGDLWLMQDSAGRDAMGDLLGIPTVGQTAITPVNGIAPLFDGPFGVANNVQQGGGEEGFVSEADVLANNGTVVGRNTENQVIAAFWGPDQYALGAGALIVVADIDMFTSQATFGTTLGDLNDNGIFALNAFAFLSTSTEPLPRVPEPATLLLLGGGMAMLGLRRRGRRHR